MKNLILYTLLLLTFAVKAQEKDNYLPKGNESFEAKKYADAESDYRISQSKFSKKAASSYNLGNSIYKQNQPGEAKYHFANAAKEAKTKPEKHKAFHNLGNTLMSEKNYAGAVEAYKNALRNDPSDNETRYNYALAKKMLKDNPPKDDKKNKDKNKDKDKDKKDDKKDPNKDKKDDKKDNPDKDKKDDKGQNQQPKPDEFSKQKIQNLLNAVNNEEKKVQDKVKGKEMKAPVKAEKDW